MTISAPQFSRPWTGSSVATGAAPAASRLAAELLELAADPRIEAGLRAECREWGRSADAEEAARGALQLARRLKRDFRFENAARILQLLQTTDAPAEVAATARTELAGMAGGGGFGMRAEFLAANFCREATDPRSLLPMLGAGILGEIVGAAAFARFAAAGRGVRGARVLAGTLAFAAETGAFAGLHRAISPEAGSGFARDLARAGLSLGTMRAWGFLGGGLGIGLTRAARYEGSAAAQRLADRSTASLAELSAFAGLWAARYGEARLGLSAAAPGDASFLEALAGYFSLRSGARLGQSLLRGGLFNLRTERKAAELFRVHELDFAARDPFKAGVLVGLVLGASACRSPGINLDARGLAGLGGLALAGLMVYGLIRSTRRPPPLPGEFVYRLSPSNRWLLRDFYFFGNVPEALTWRDWRKIQGEVLTAARLVGRYKAMQIPVTWKSLELRRLAIDLLTEKELHDLRQQRLTMRDPFPSPYKAATPKELN